MNYLRIQRHPLKEAQCATRKHRQINEIRETVHEQSQDINKYRQKLLKRTRDSGLEEYDN